MTEKNNKSISQHEEGREHKICLLIYSKRENSIDRIDDSLIKELNNEYKYCKDLLVRLVKIIKFIANRGLAFRGTDKKLGSTKNRNYLGLIELISEYDPFLKNYLKLYDNKGSSKTFYLSVNICRNELKL